MKEEQVFHTIPPVYDKTSRVLLLGTMPSPKSREAGFYYGHPQNRMWKVLGQVFGEETPMGTEARRAFLLRHHIAMWDVLAACTIRGAEDSSIADAVPNDIRPILAEARWRKSTPPDTKHFLFTENISSRLRGGRPFVCPPPHRPTAAGRPWIRSPKRTACYERQTRDETPSKRGEASQTHRFFQKG